MSLLDAVTDVPCPGCTSPAAAIPGIPQPRGQRRVMRGRSGVGEYARCWECDGTGFCSHRDAVLVDEFDQVDFDRDGGPGRHYETVQVLVCPACDSRVTCREPKP